MSTKFTATIIVLSAISSLALADASSGAASEATLAAQNAALSTNTNGKGFRRGHNNSNKK